MLQMIEAAGLLLMTQSEPPQFLLMQHDNRWDLPKGHAEAGEDLLQTALRETQEETGIAPQQIAVDPDFQFSLEYEVRSKKRGNYTKRVTYFLGFVRQRHPVQLTEHIGYQWLSWPVSGALQAQTIDPLLAAVADHLHAHPERLQIHS